MESALHTIAICIGTFGAFAACESKQSAKDDPSPPVASAHAPGSASTRRIEPAIPEDKVKKVINPLGEEPYAGPTATVSGVVRVTGDPPPVLDEVVEQIDGKCENAKRVYGTLFREGPGRTLADALVAVTEYKGFVPPKGNTRVVAAKGCAFETRTIAMTFGQTLQILNKGGEAVIPELLGTKMHALVVAMPGGDPVTLFPTQAGHSMLKDNTRDYALADVFILKYSTTDVTGLDGRFEISGVPVGRVQLSAYLPATGQTLQRELQLEAGQETNLELEIAFDAQKHTPKAPQ